MSSKSSAFSFKRNSWYCCCQIYLHVWSPSLHNLIQQALHFPSVCLYIRCQKHHLSFPVLTRNGSWVKKSKRKQNLNLRKAECEGKKFSEKICIFFSRFPQVINAPKCVQQSCFFSPNHGSSFAGACVVALLMTLNPQIWF